MSNPQNRAYRLLYILRDHAPNVKAQEICSRMYHKAIMDGASDEDLEKTMANALADGLNHGNWPWSAPTGRQPVVFTFQVGKKYHILYRLGTQRADREAVMKYLGEEKTLLAGNKNGRMLSFSARPYAGTQTIPSDRIFACKLVSDDTECYVDIKVKTK